MPTTSYENIDLSLDDIWSAIDLTKRDVVPGNFSTIMLAYGIGHFTKVSCNIFATKIVLTIARKTLPSSKTYLFKTVHFFMKFYFYESLMTPCNCGLPYRGQRIYEVAFDYQNPAHVVRNAEG